MALKDRMQGMLVYFGLAEEPDVDGGWQDEPTQSSKAPVRRLPQRRGRDEIDDLFSDDEPVSAERRPSRLRSVSTGGDQRVHMVSPKSFNDAQEIGDHFREGVPVITNLQATDPELSKRIIDFASGLTYALEGGIQQIAEKVFVLTPRNVQFSAEQRAAMIEKGFFNQS